MDHHERSRLSFSVLLRSCAFLAALLGHLGLAAYTEEPGYVVCALGDTVSFLAYALPRPGRRSPLRFSPVLAELLWCSGHVGLALHGHVVAYGICASLELSAAWLALRSIRGGHTPVAILLESWLLKGVALGHLVLFLLGGHPLYAICAAADCALGLLLWSDLVAMTSVGDDRDSSVQPTGE